MASQCTREARGCGRTGETLRESDCGSCVGVGAAFKPGCATTSTTGGVRLATVAVTRGGGESRRATGGAREDAKGPQAVVVGGTSEGVAPEATPCVTTADVITVVGGGATRLAVAEVGISPVMGSGGVAATNVMEGVKGFGVGGCGVVGTVTVVAIGDAASAATGAATDVAPVVTTDVAITVVIGATVVVGDACAVPNAGTGGDTTGAFAKTTGPRAGAGVLAAELLGADRVGLASNRAARDIAGTHADVGNRGVREPVASSGAAGCGGVTGTAGALCGEASRLGTEAARAAAASAPKAALACGDVAKRACF